jgi:hypothetical protein
MEHQWPVYKISKKRSQTENLYSVAKIASFFVEILQTGHWMDGDGENFKISKKYLFLFLARVDSSQSYVN